MHRHPKKALDHPPYAVKFASDNRRAVIVVSWQPPHVPHDELGLLTRTGDTLNSLVPRIQLDRNKPEADLGFVMIRTSDQSHAE
jgi:hypothetical protein